MIGISPFPFGGVSPFAFLGTDNQFVSAATSVYTFSDIDFGEAGGRRTLVFSLVWRASSAARSLVSATIGGVAATIVDQKNNAVDASVSVGTAIVMAVVPSGTTGSLVLTLSASLGTMTLVYGLYSKSAAVVGQHNSSNLTNPTATLDVPANGFALGVAGSFLSSGFTGWTGLTADFANSTVLVGASLETVPALPAHTMKATFSGSTLFACGSFATFH